MYVCITIYTLVSRKKAGVKHIYMSKAGEKHIYISKEESKKL